MEPGTTGHLASQSTLVSINETEKMSINRTPQMQPQVRQSFVNYKDIPAASNAGLRMKKTNSRPNNRCVMTNFSFLIPFIKKTASVTTLHW